MRIFFAGVCALAGIGSPALAVTLHTTTFDADADGWAGASFPQPERVTSGGPAGENDAYLRAPNGGNGNLAVHNISGAWTGSFAEIGAAQIHADLMSPLDSAPLQIRVVLFSISGARWTSTAAQAVPNDGAWRNYTFSIGDDALMRVLGFEGDTYAGLMSDIARVMFRHDTVGGSGGTPVQGTLNLDNIELAAAPPIDVPGDFNDDGVVDGADLTDPTLGFQARYGVDLDGEDFLVWQQNVSVSPGAVAAASVPEPRAFTLILAAAALVSWQLRTSRRRNL